MIRVIEQLGMLKDDLKEELQDLLYQNKIKNEIVVECKVMFRVQLLLNDIENNEESMIELQKTIEEVDQVIEMLVLAEDESKK